MTQTRIVNAMLFLTLVGCPKGDAQGNVDGAAPSAATPVSAPVAKPIVVAPSASAPSTEAITPMASASAVASAPAPPSASGATAVGTCASALDAVPLDAKPDWLLWVDLGELSKNNAAQAKLVAWIGTKARLPSETRRVLYYSNASTKVTAVEFGTDSAAPRGYTKIGPCVYATKSEGTIGAASAFRAAIDLKLASLKPARTAAVAFGAERDDKNKTGLLVGFVVDTSFELNYLAAGTGAGSIDLGSLKASVDGRLGALKDAIKASTNVDVGKVIGEKSEAGKTTLVLKAESLFDWF
jgi:hypothetical protein